MQSVGTTEPARELRTCMLWDDPSVRPRWSARSTLRVPQGALRVPDAVREHSALGGGWRTVRPSLTRSRENGRNLTSKGTKKASKGANCASKAYEKSESAFIYKPMALADGAGPRPPTAVRMR